MDNVLSSFDGLKSNLALVASMLKLKMKTYDPSSKDKPTKWAIKLDGYCLNIVKTKQGEVYAFTRNGTNLTTTLLNVAPELLAPVFQHLEPDSFLIGELHTGTTSKDVSTALTSRQNAEALKLALTIFYVHGAAGHQTAEAYCFNRGLDYVKHGAFNALEPMSCLPYTIETLPVGVEGYVLSHNYRDGVRYKYKPSRTIDLIVTDVIRGKGKYANCTGALELSSYDGVRVCKVASGLSDEERYLWWRTPGLVLGRVAEISYDSVSVSSVRFPRFVRLRADKPETECTLDQDEELKEVLCKT